MSAIKRFFEKKKADAKFKLAGSGQKLGDSAAAQAAAAAASRSGPSQERPQASRENRGHLSQEQKLAASAALDW